MARADLIYELIKYGLINDSIRFRKAAEALCAEERSKKHTILANRIKELLNSNQKSLNSGVGNNQVFIRNSITEQQLFWEKVPQKKLKNLILPEIVKKYCDELIQEQTRVDLLRSYGLEPRNKILLIGPPGNGKTSIAEAIAEALMIPLLTVRYESVIGSYLGETASRLSKLIEYAKTRQCVIFFDEFETLGKERGDIHETGEIKRVVSSLLMHIDSIPSYTIVIAATNHENLLDKAAWRRFQIRLELPKPTRRNLELFYENFENNMNFSFGLMPSSIAKKTYGISYAEAEELAFAIYRQYILQMPESDSRIVTEKALMLWKNQANAPVLSEISKKGDKDKCTSDQ